MRTGHIVQNVMNTEPIVFKQGEENGIVIERDNFERSIFRNQYQQAIDIFNRLWKYQRTLIPQGDEDCAKAHNDFGVDNHFSNIIAFCGDRGEGKSSCMSSFATTLTDKSARDNALTIFPKLSEYENFKIEWLDVIDPSFFDTSHNLLELLIGRMYAKTEALYKEKDSDNSCTKAYKFRLLLEQFQKVKKDIAMVEKNGNIYDSLEEISDLAAGVHLKSDLKTLFKYYLDCVDKDCLLICIDDLDLNISEGYKMAEMLRKYLICPYCVILVAVKVEQLIEVIATALKKEVKDSEIKWEQCLIMAQKYVTKLLPREQRVVMPNSLDICERRIQIAENNKNPKFDAMTVKERIVQLIFQKTGYVFYNSQSTSPIIPRNLRSIRHLLGTLEVLPDARSEKWEDSEIGREVFQDYFYGTWATAYLSSEDYDFASRLSQYDDLITLNSFVVEYFAKRVKKADIEIKEHPKTDSKKQQSIEDVEGETYTGDYAPLYLQITNRTNTSANISVGDVMYILWLINTITVDPAIQNLIFFIKTTYSMRLYSCYNEITGGKDSTLFPEIDHSVAHINIHKADSLYDRVNRMQRITNGSYFSYPEGSLLSNKRDSILIDFRKVKEIYSILREEAKKEKEERRESYSQLVQLCEFLALCITIASTKENIEKKNFAREAKTPTFLGTFSHTASSAIFDFLNPFYALTNIKYSYHRFDEILSDTPNNYNDNDPSQQNKLYGIAEDCKDSLLVQMKHIREGVYKDKWEMHGLVSDAIIRVSDIQWAIYEELLRQYHTHRVGSIAEKIYHAYGDIQKLNITLYPRLTINDGKVVKGHDADEVKFEFLSILRSFLVKPENASQLNAIITITEADELLADTTQFLENIHRAIARIYDWPIAGDEVKSVIKKASLLAKSQQSSFSARLGKVFKSKDLYTREQVMEKIGQIRDIYMTARAK